jgi:hypothetical protein
MGVDGVAAAAGNLRDDRLKAAIRDFDRPAAAPAHDVVMMLLGLTGDVRMLAVGQVEPFERAELSEEIQVPEERGAAQAEALSTGVAEEFGSGEVATPRTDEVRDGTARPRQAVAGVHNSSNDALHAT